MSDLNTNPATAPAMPLPELSRSRMRSRRSGCGGRTRARRLASALAEQNGNEVSAAAAGVFQPLSKVTSTATRNDIDMILDIPVQMTVELGRTKIAIRNLLQLAQGSVVELDGLAGEPMDVLVNGCLIAQGEVVVVKRQVRHPSHRHHHAVRADPETEPMKQGSRSGWAQAVHLQSRTALCVSCRRRREPRGERHRGRCRVRRRSSPTRPTSTQ